MTVSLESVDSPNGWCFGFIGIYGFYKVFICCLYGFYVVFIRFLCLYIYIYMWFLCGFNMFFYIVFYIVFYMVYMVYMVYIIWFIWNILGRYFPMMVIWYWYGNIPSGKRLRSYGSHGPFIDGNIMGIYWESITSELTLRVQIGIIILQVSKCCSSRKIRSPCPGQSSYTS